MFSIPPDKTIEYFLKIFYKTGLWQRDDESDLRKIGKKFFLIIFCAFLPIFFAINSVLCVDRNESIFSVQTTFEMIIVYVKFLYLLLKKQEIIEFLYDPIIGHSIQNQTEYEQTNQKIQKLMKFIRPYSVAVYITSVVVIIIKLPIFSSDGGLPYFISFSWNDSKIVYWLVYVLIGLVSPFYATINLSTSIIWFLTFNYSIEHELLGNKLRKLGTGKETDETKRQSGYVQDLIILIKAHRNLTETIERFRNCFSTLFFGQITTSGICICTSVYSISFATRENIVQTELHVIMLVHAILDIFVIMYLTNDITLASGNLSYCLYESNWIEQTESCKKYVLIMGEVFKQPQELVILIYPMSLETFMTIANGAYSMFNILTNFQ